MNRIQPQTWLQWPNDPMYNIAIVLGIVIVECDIVFDLGSKRTAC